MPSPATISATVLAVIFVVAAVAKFRDPAATRRSMSDFGLPNAGLH